MKEENNILDQLKKTEKSALPANYFDDLSQTILSEIQKKEDTKVFSINRFKYGMIAACASIILLLSFQFFTSSDIQLEPKNNDFIVQNNTSHEDEIADFFLEMDDFDLSEVSLSLEDI